jgi:hypothetical protein
MTDTMDATSITQLIDQHLLAYGQPDGGERAPIIARIWSTDGRLVDPPLDGSGHTGVSALADAVAQHFPGHTFHRTTPVDAHHGFARYGWELRAPTDEVALTGTDFVTLTDDGRLQQVVGFFGELGPLGG